MEREAIGRAARLLVEARSDKRRIDALPTELRPTGLAEAYAIQAASLAGILEDAGGGQRLGRKIGCTNAAAQAQLNQNEPFRGALLSPFVHASPATLPADAFFIRMLEPEIAFRLGRDLPAANAPYDAASVKSAIATVMPAIEIVDSRFSDWTTAGGPQLIADNACAGHWVHGTKSPDVEAIDFANHPISISLNGELKERGSSGNALGSSLNALAWLANDLARYGQGLAAGELVTTGTCTSVIPAEKGDVGVADFGALGQVSVSFT